MLTPCKAGQFKKDQKRAEKQGKDFELLHEVLKVLIKVLIEGKPLPHKYQDHPLTGPWKGYRDCHITNDWVLIYKVDKKNKTLLLQRLGSHSELFG